MKIVLIMALKDIRLLMRDKMSLFFTFFFPLLYAGLFGTILSGQMEGGTHAMTVLLVDEDRTQGSRAFIEQLAAAAEVEIVEEGLEAARESVRKGRNAAYILLPPGFGGASESLFSGNPPRLQIGVDPRRQAEEGMLKGILMKYAAENQIAAFQDPEKRTKHLAQAREAAADAPPEVRESLERMFAEFEILMAASDESPGDSEEGEARFEGLYPLEMESVPVIVEREGPRNYYDISFPQGIIWGIMATAAGFAISLVVERRQGTLLRLQTAPVGRRRILGGKAAACFLTTIVIAGVLVLFAILVFGMRPQAPAFLAMAVVSVALCFVGLMMLFSVLGKTEQSAAAIGWIALMIMAMVGGGMLPLFMMPGWLRAAGSFSPVKWAILAMEGAIWRQFSLAEMLLPCAILVGVGILCFGIGVRAFRWSAEV